MLPVEMRTVDDGAVRASPFQLGRHFAPRFVVIEKRMNHRVPFEKRNRFRKMDDRVQHRNVDMLPFVRLYRKVGEEIQKSLECDDSIGTVVNCSNVFW